MTRFNRTPRYINSCAKGASSSYLGVNMSRNASLPEEHQSQAKTAEGAERPAGASTSERALSHEADPVEAASQGSFPASDPPAWTLGNQSEPQPPADPLEPVDESSQESFPASDPPAWTSESGSKEGS